MLRPGTQLSQGESSPAPSDTFPRALTSPCWLWTGRKSGDYGQATYKGNHPTYKGRTLYTHQIAWLEAGGELSKFKVLDHICGNKLCCNAEHLEQVSRSENLTRERMRGSPVGRKPAHPEEYEKIVELWRAGKKPSEIVELLGGYGYRTVQRIITKEQHRQRFAPRNSLFAAVREFVSQKCAKCDNAWISHERFYREWVSWARERGIKPSDRSSFGRALRQAVRYAGYQVRNKRRRVNGKQLWGYDGIDLDYGRDPW